MRYISGECTRKEFIDPPLEKADWYLCDKTKEGIKIVLFEQEHLPYGYNVTAVVAQYERLREQMCEAERQIKGLLESLLRESFA